MQFCLLDGNGRLGVAIMVDKPDGGVDLGHSHEDPVSGC